MKKTSSALLDRDVIQDYFSLHRSLTKIVFTDNKDARVKDLTKADMCDWWKDEGYENLNYFYDERNKTAYFTSKSGEFTLSADASRMFYGFSKLEAIEGTEKIDTSMVHRMWGGI